ncbi:VOC family protein [Fictibacillus barbaricus]|uniref:Catechol 2,3-dioxygenase-like lactoylglutathione lyase family enzyme n=1 Tax=Fictibacillus barbaricus TaxID=182136 RepID=A0ABU1TXZ5_9BACL|nr:VOC family protein [Fictibacillus barbaricus]MDR7072069.1 catechol 2,3-dioxygenase-like lactoylglutathione lyase family enzyme [Fictibacillus barbaricus]
MKIVGVHHVQLCIPANQEKEAQKFYCEILQLQEIEKPDSLKKNGGMWFQLGSQELHIGVENLSGPKGKQHPAFLVQEIDLWRNHLIEQGINIQKEAAIPGFNRFSIRDPFDNRLEFIEPI